MIILEPLTPNQAINFKTKFPNILQIWDREGARKEMIEHKIEWGEGKCYGEILFIKNNDTIVGITGWYDLSVSGDTNFPVTHAALRWHGILKDHRRKGYSQIALKLLSKRILEKDVTKTHLVEIYPKDRPHIADHFIKMGFEKEGRYRRPDSLTYTEGLVISANLRILANS